MTVCKKEAHNEAAEDKCLKNAMKTGRVVNTKNLYMEEAATVDAPKSSRPGEQPALADSRSSRKTLPQPSLKFGKKMSLPEETSPQPQEPHKFKPRYYMIKRNQITARDASKTKLVSLTTRKNKTKVVAVSPLVDMSDDSSDCSNAENKLDNYYAESRTIETKLMETHRNKNKEIKFSDTISSVMRLEYLRRKILETNCEKINRVIKE